MKDINKQDLYNFINKYPNEFDELVSIFKKIKFDVSDNLEVKTLLNNISVIKDNDDSFTDFIKTLINNFSIYEIILIIKQKIKEKNKNYSNLKHESNVLYNIDADFSDLEKSLLPSSIKSLSNVCETTKDNSNNNNIKNITIERDIIP